MKSVPGRYPKVFHLIKDCFLFQVHEYEVLGHQIDDHWFSSSKKIDMADGRCRTSSFLNMKMASWGILKDTEAGGTLEGAGWNVTGKIHFCRGEFYRELWHTALAQGPC